MTAATIAEALGGRKAGAEWMARCPAHEDREPSLSIKDADGGKVLVRCHAGCDQQKVIAALKARGIWLGSGRRHGTLIRSKPSPAAKDEPDRDDAERTQTALRLWGDMELAKRAELGRHLEAMNRLDHRELSGRFARKHGGLRRDGLPARLRGVGEQDRRAHTIGGEKRESGRQRDGAPLRGRSWMLAKNRRLRQQAGKGRGGYNSARPTQIHLSKKAKKTIM